jgi:hypothetical protein
MVRGSVFTELSFVCWKLSSPYVLLLFSLGPHILYPTNILANAAVMLDTAQKHNMDQV